MYILAMAVVALVSYIIGSLNSAIIIVFLMTRKDVRDYGSNNAGLTNVYRCFGPVCAALTLITDLAKGFIVVFGTKLSLFATGLFSNEEHDVVTACLVASAFAVLGHVFPVFYKFKGGKGILVGATCALAIHPIVFLCGIIVMVLAVVITRYISVGSILCCLGYPLFFYIAERFGGTLSEYTYLHMILAGIMGLLCLVRHASNIKRLFNHTENKFTMKKS